MYYVSEEAVHRSVTQADVTAAIADAFSALSKGTAFNFPVAREKLNYADAVFGFKAAFDRTSPALGVKAGGLWPGNRAKGLPNHQSTTLLFDPETGGPHALVRSTYLTALRTAAASALSIRALARRDARVLGLIGTGGQAAYQVSAALAERPFERLLVFDSGSGSAERLRRELDGIDLPVELAGAERVAGEADVLITITSAFRPVVEADWVRPGTHVACMGADTRGKHEVAAELVARAALFSDEPEQAVTIGECQHAHDADLIKAADIVTLGDVLNGTVPGRTDEREITLFDSSGVGLQDLAAAQVALARAQEAGLAVAMG